MSDQDSPDTPTSGTSDQPIGPPQADVPAPQFSAAPSLPMPDLGAPQTATPTLAPQPNHMWRQVVQGALTGLAAGGVVGSFTGGLSAGINAGARQQKQQAADLQAASDRIKFASAQSASLIAQATQHDAHLHNLPDNLQDSANSSAQDTVENLKAFNLFPSLVLPNTQDAAETGLQTLTQRDGSVQPTAVVNTGDKLHAYDLLGAISKPGGVAAMNQASVLQGGPLMDRPMVDALPDPVKIKMMHDAITLLNKVPGNANEAMFLNEQAKSYQATAKANPNTPDDVQDRIDARVRQTQSYLDHFNSNTVSQAGAVANAKDAAAAANKPAPVAKASPQVVGFNPQSGQREVTDAATAQAGGFQQTTPVKAADLDRWGTAQNQFANVQLAVSRYTEAATTFSKSGSPNDVAGINSALNKAGIGDVQIGEWGVRIPGFSSVAEAASRMANSTAFKSMSPAGQDLVDKYFRMLSSIPEYQKAATGIGKTNKEMLDLELKNIPDPTMPPQVILNRMGSFQEALTSNASRVPYVKGVQSATDIQKSRGAKQQPSFTVPAFNQ